jgi:hypothetical protein
MDTLEMTVVVPQLEIPLPTQTGYSHRISETAIPLMTLAPVYGAEVLTFAQVSSAMAFQHSRHGLT